MKSSSTKTKLVNLLPSCAVFGFLLLSSFLTVNAQTVTFAQFLESSGSQDFVFTNNSTSGDFSAVTGGSAVDFKYQNIIGLPPSLQGFQTAHLFVTTTTTQPASVAGGTITQPLNQSVTIQIIRDTPAPAGTGGGSRTNLLTVVFSPAANTPGIVGSGNSANLSATTPAATDENVTFTSNFLVFTATTQRNLALSFSSVNPALAIGAGGFLQNFSAAGSGTFASNPLPTYAGPTAASVSLNGRVSTSSGRGLRNAEVILVSGDGTVRSARTSSFGYFEFTDITAGQTVTVSVRSKQYSFASQTISLQDNATGIDFVASP